MNAKLKTVLVPSAKVQHPQQHLRLKKFDVGGAFVSLLDVLLNVYEYPLNRQSLIDLCKTQHNEENVEAWVELHNWTEDVNSKTSSENITAARMLVGKYIGDTAEIQVNISMVDANKILQAQEEAEGKGEISADHFNAALVQIEDIIQEDILPRFIKVVRIRLDQFRSRGAALWMFNPSSIKSFSDFFFFPAVVNEAESRLHALLLGVQMIAFLLLGWFTPYWYPYLYVVYGFTVRLLTGPRLCPNAWLVIFVLSPLNTKYNIFENVLVASRSKRFAQLMGLIFSSLYCILITDYALVARLLAIVHIILGLIAGILDFCVACWMYHTVENMYASHKAPKTKVFPADDGPHDVENQHPHPPQHLAASSNVASCKNCKEDPFVDCDDLE
jgi:hypothetical protein